MRLRYRRKPDQAVSAVRLALEFDSFSYRKWGGEQRAQVGDWLVDNDGEVYTVAADSFASTYRQLSPGRWLKKVTSVWAEQAARAGAVATKEGQTQYEAGDWLVSNAGDGSDAYAIEAQKFEQTYELDPDLDRSAAGAGPATGG